MATISVVTDSAANLPKAVADELGTRIVPVMVNLEGKAYRDGIDITPGEVYRRQREGGFVPTTSTPRVADFVAAYEDVAREADGETASEGIIDELAGMIVEETAYAVVLRRRQSE